MDSNGAVGGTTQHRSVLGSVLEGRYRVDAPLARGGMSSVYRGVDLRLDRPVAIKVMEPAFAGDRAFIDRFEREARSAAKLHHPCVVGVHDQGVDHSPDGDRVYLVMELVDGGTLRDLLTERGALPLGVAFAVLDPLLSALAAAHRAGLVHRDVKPENVLIGSGGAVKVGDFGLVRAIASARTTSANLILGTVAYLSPEQVTTGASDPRSDVYAVGVVLYEMLTGAPPYAGDTPLSVAYRHVNDDMPPPSEADPAIPAAVDDLVLRATRRDPALRPADAAAFLLELGRVRASLGVPRVPVPTPTREDRLPAIPYDEEPGIDTVAMRNTEPVDPESTQKVSVRPSPIGPQGTRALSRDELGPARHEPPRPPGPPVNPYDAQRRRSRRVFLIWIAIVLLLAAAIGVGAWWLGSGRWTAVPNVTNLDTAQAQSLLSAADLHATVRRQHDDTIIAGQAIGTVPKVGTRELRGSDVVLLMSEGKPVVPAVQPGSTVQQAEQAIRDAGLVPRTDPAQNAYDGVVPAGDVLRVIPAGGTQLNLNSPVTIVVSKGPPPKPVPNVVGMPHDQAFAALSAAGYSPFDEPAQFSGQVPGGDVISTDPAAGTVVDNGGNKRVGVVVSTAVTVPNLSQQSVQQAEATLQGLKLVPQVQSFGNNPNAMVLAQSVPPGSLVAPGTQVIIYALL